jgi:hypothetical protein
MTIRTVILASLLPMCLLAEPAWAQKLPIKPFEFPKIPEIEFKPIPPLNNSNIGSHSSSGSDSAWIFYVGLAAAAFVVFVVTELMSGSKPSTSKIQEPPEVNSAGLCIDCSGQGARWVLLSNQSGMVWTKCSRCDGLGSAMPDPLEELERDESGLPAKKGLVGPDKSKLRSFLKVALLFGIPCCLFGFLFGAGALTWGVAGLAAGMLWALTLFLLSGY